MSALTCPASFGQRLLWLLDHYRGGDGALNIAQCYSLRGRLDLSALQSALDAVVQRHESLRTTFSGAGRRLTQGIHGPQAALLTVIEARDERHLDAALSREVSTRFDVAADLPLRVTLFRRTESEGVLCINVHHLAADAWSMSLLCNELRLLYERYAYGLDVAVPDVVWQYRDFVAWQQQRLASEAARSHIEYWEERLTGIRFAPLPPRSASRTDAGAERISRLDRFVLERAIVDRLSDVARAARVSLFMLALGGFQVTLASVTNCEQASVASIFANRTRRETENTIGFLANMVLLPADLTGISSFGEVLKEVRSVTLGAMAHQELPYQMLPLRALSGEERSRASDLVFHMFSGPARPLHFRGVEVTPLEPPDRSGTLFDLEVVLIPETTGLVVRVHSAMDRFDPDWIHALAFRFLAVLRSVAERPDAPISVLRRDPVRL